MNYTNDKNTDTIDAAAESITEAVQNALSRFHSDQLSRRDAEDFVAGAARYALRGLIRSGVTMDAEGGEVPGPLQKAWSCPANIRRLLREGERQRDRIIRQQAQTDPVEAERRIAGLAEHVTASIRRAANAG